MIKPYSHVLVALLKGIIYNANEELWNDLNKPENLADIKRYFADIFLEVIVEPAEGYAYLKQMVSEDPDVPYPKIIEKRQLNYHFSLLCLLLRKHLIENDREAGFAQVILTKEDIINMARPFYKETTNEALQQKQIETAIAKLIDEGFIRKMKTEDEQYEINRIIKAFVNADKVKDSLEKLREYAKQPAE